MTNLIDQAGQATGKIKYQIHELKVMLNGIDTTCNAFGILNDPGMLLADLDQVFRAVSHIQTGIINTQWPKAADYAEV